MTFRQRPAPKRARSQRSSRQTLYTNLLFGGVVLFALVILAVAAGVNWYANHWQPIATVDGASITRDQFTDRVRVDLWRISAVESKIRDAATNGLITNTERDQEIAQINQEKSNTNSLYGSSVQSLIDAQLQARLATDLGIAITDADVDARMQKEASSDEQRHVLVIEVAPEVVAPATTPTDAAVATALTKANALAARLAKGEDWATVAKDSTDPLATGGGDQGFISKATSVLDPPLLTAVFALPANGITAVIKGDDGTFRFGQVTRIVPATTDPNYTQTIVNSGVPLDSYRQAVRADAVRDALKARVLADDTTKPSVQRHVLEIKLTQDIDQQTNSPVLTDQVDVRHILYAPGGKDAVGSPPPSGDPAWDAAKAQADATYQALLKDPSKFADIAKSDSADTASAAAGGDIGFQAQASLDPAFGTAIFKPGLTKDEILPPVKSVYGWHVIQFVARKTPALNRMNDYINQLAKPGADFGAIAKANSEAADASKGGDMGWIAHDQLSKKLEDAIFALPVGTVSGMIVDGADLYVFKVVEEQTRLPDKDQITALTSSGFTNWYATQQAKAKIDVDPAFSQYLTASTGA
ncbi:MAG: peptidyl-prolyl cis-trans isomerase SurA [Chloroflexota bacterium]|nr:peptidyl-prolyl cis-trans isomerase SurA [Chloroflexota bacterium]